MARTRSGKARNSAIRAMGPCGGHGTRSAPASLWSGRRRTAIGDGPSLPVRRSRLAFTHVAPATAGPQACKSALRHTTSGRRLQGARKRLHSAFACSGWRPLRFPGSSAAAVPFHGRSRRRCHSPHRHGARRPMPGRSTAPAPGVRAASGVPSATITTPECCENPMPTPPPWCSDTQVAPRGGVDQRVQQRPVGDGIRAVLHRFGFAVGRGDRA